MNVAYFKTLSIELIVWRSLSFYEAQILDFIQLCSFNN